MWFVFALITFTCWGCADLFYKKGAAENEKYSHLKTAMTVGFVMGVHALAVLATGDIGYDFVNILVYLPVSVMYILSMTVGYFGLRYLELSVSSPVQNASGALTCLLCLIILGTSMDTLTSVGVILICAGVILLGFIEKKETDSTLDDNAENKKFRMGFKAFFIPIAYCIIDALGTFFDAYYLDDFEKTPLVGVNEENFENVANISYELTFLICAIAIFVFLRIKRQKTTQRMQFSRLGAALFETAGQFTYVYAMSGNGTVASPIIASYCILSVVLSALFLHEKPGFKKYVAIAVVALGIVLCGIAEG